MGRGRRMRRGPPLNMPTETLTSSLRTYAAALNSEAWNDSSSSENLYKTIFFRGATTGVFHHPLGESSLVTNLTGGATSQTFTLGPHRLRLHSQQFDDLHSGCQLYGGT